MTAVVAWLALLVSGASLGWQVAVWKKTAARVVVDLGPSTTYYDEEEEHHVAVIVINVGRVATTVNEVGLTYHEPTLQNSHKTMIFGEYKNTETEESGLPKRLEPGEEFPMSFEIGNVWSLPLLDFVNETAAETRDKVEIRGYVRVGRETVYAPRSVTLERPTG